MQTLLILLLCLTAVFVYILSTIWIPNKISNYALSIVIMVVGILLSILPLFFVALLGKHFGILEQTKSYILITLAINAFIDTIYRFIKRCRQT